LWVDTATFENICRDSERQAAVLGSASTLSSGPIDLTPVRYLQCAECHELMHRVNFARCSGVVVDVCRAHGTWFDKNELHRIVQFIRDGGLDQSRDRQKIELAEQQRRGQEARIDTGRTYSPTPTVDPDDDLLSLVIGAAGGLVSWWLRK
jgi:Zn-finger nucleic acid-binding protein